MADRSLPPYDFLIVGAGLFGAVFAHEARKRGRRCLVVDRRSHVGGNTWCEDVEGIHVHRYGAHIFHTNNTRIWEYVNALVPFRPYRHTVRADFRGRQFRLPFNMHTFAELWGVSTPEEARARIAADREGMTVAAANNLEECAVAMVGRELFETLIRGYTEKQWGRSASELPASIIKRLPVRFTFDDAYFDDRYQGIPEGGYNRLTGALLDGVEVRLGVDYLADRNALDGLARRTVFSGCIDEFFDRELGTLEYRSLRFEHKVVESMDVQGCPVLNFADRETPFTRRIEHRHLAPSDSAVSVVTEEYPQAWAPGHEPYYPIADSRNLALLDRYRKLARSRVPTVIFGGRLAEYRYLDMHQVIGAALSRARRALDPSLNPASRADATPEPLED